MVEVRRIAPTIRQNLLEDIRGIECLCSISLTSDQAAITCIANDFGYEKIFSRQVEGIGKPGDVLICLTTSGNSKNILNAIKSAKRKKNLRLS